MKESKLDPESLVGNVPLIQSGKYDDDKPYHEVSYLNCKFILKPEPFKSRKDLFAFSEEIKRACAKFGVKFTNKGFDQLPIQIREVIFVDTPDFKLYNNAFILRRRVSYVDGFPVGDPEIVFKFRHPDIQMAAATDVRPNIKGNYKIKFKCQFLPLRAELGGMRMLFSHNVQFQRSEVGHDDIYSLEAMSRVFPALKVLKDENSQEDIKLVNDLIIEEVLQDIGEIDFGKRTKSTVDVGLWRTRGEHKPLIAEFAFKFSFNGRDKLNRKALLKFETFFKALQFELKDWISLDTTKTGIVYRYAGNTPTSHE